MGWVETLLNLLRDNFLPVSNFAFALTVAAAAVATARFSLKLANETVALRKAETDPFVAVYIEQRKSDIHFFDLVIRNVARGSAFDVSFDVSPDIPLWEGDDYRLSHATVIGDGIRYMAPGQELRFFFGSYVELVKQPIIVTVNYYGSDGASNRTTFNSSFTLNVEQFAGMTHITEKSIASVATSLETITQHVRAIREGQAEIKVSVHRRFVFSRYITRKWKWLFGSYPANSLRDLWTSFLKRHGPP